MGILSFFSELKKRKVYRTAAAYAVVAFVIMQIIEIVFPMFDIPDWAGRMIIILLFLGLPITIIFSWMYDVGEKGMTRAKPMMAEGAEDARSLFIRKRSWLLVGGAVLVILFGYQSADSIFGYKIGKEEINKKSIAVLPFDNYSTAPEDQYFSDGVTEVITANLAKIKGLKVISRTSVMEYKNTTKKIKEIAEELGVAHILEGSIQRIGDNIRIVGQLINAETDEHIWAETYDGKIDDIFMMQTDVALKISTALKAEISDEATALISEKSTENVQAYDLYLKALELGGFSQEETQLKKAIVYLKSSISLDDRFTEAYALLGDMHLMYYWMNFDRSTERLEKAKVAIDIAKGVKPNHPSVLKAKGTYYYYGFRNYAKALVHYEKARAITPGDADVWARIGWINRRIGEWDEAINYLEKRLQLNPRGVESYADLGETFRTVGDYNNAVKYFSKAVEISPSHVISYVNLSEVLYYELDDKKTAIEALERDLVWSDNDSKKKALYHFYLGQKKYDKALNVAKSFTKDIVSFQSYVVTKTSLLGLINKLDGKKEKADDQFLASVSLLENELQKDPNDYSILISLGINYAHLGKRQKAIKYGKRSVEILPETKDSFLGPDVLSNLGLIYTILGMEDEAIDVFDHVTSVPAGFSIGFLKEHPHFIELRKNPRFKQILIKNRLVL